VLPLGHFVPLAAHAQTTQDYSGIGEAYYAQEQYSEAIAAYQQSLSFSQTLDLLQKS